MELRLLSSFVVLAQELHFGRAARRLHISQPPLSAQIMKLEEALGARLFERTNRRVALTEAGHALVGRAHYLLAEVERARNEVMRVGTGHTGVLAIGYTPTATYEIMPPLLRRYREQNPDIALELFEMTSPAQVVALREGRIEVGFACLPVDTRDLDVHVLDVETLVVALPRSHPLARKATVRVRDLARESFVLVDPQVEPGWAHASSAALHAAGLVIRVVQQTDTKLAALGLVASGVGMTIVSRSMTAIGRRGVVFRPLTGLDVRLSLGLVTRSPRSPRTERFAAIARSLASI